MKLRIGLAILTVVAGGLVIAVCALAYHMQHRGEGPRHVYALVGDGPISNEDALRFAKDVLISDGRFHPDWEFEEWVTGSTVLRGGDDPAFISVCLHQAKTNNRWYVQLKRSSGKVECVSSPGK